MGRELSRSHGRRAATAAVTGSLLLVSLAGCGGDSLTESQARSALTREVAVLHDALTDSTDLSRPWRSESARVADRTCGDDQFRWRAVASYGVGASTETANATVQAIARLGRSGWRTQASVGDAAGAVLVPATAPGKSPAAVSADLVFVPAGGADDGLAITVTLRTACFKKS